MYGGSGWVTQLGRTAAVPVQSLAHGSAPAQRYSFDSPTSRTHSRGCPQSGPTCGLLRCPPQTLSYEANPGGPSPQPQPCRQL